MRLLHLHLLLEDLHAPLDGDADGRMRMHRLLEHPVDETTRQILGHPARVLHGLRAPPLPSLCLQVLLKRLVTSATWISS